ncbi:MAG: hypothetical protein AAF827_00425 [Cyanobacteria bacterium P01_D01_bin.6]
MTGRINAATDLAREPQEHGRDKVRIMVSGSPEGGDSIVKSLCKLRFTEMTEWSHPLPTGRAGEVMRILTKIIVT